MNNSNLKIMVKCPECQYRIFDKNSPATGIIEVKCPRCKKVSNIDLAFRKRFYSPRVKLNPLNSIQTTQLISY